MIDSKEKYRRKKMFREFVADHQKQQKTQKKINLVLAVTAGVMIGLVAFSTLAATVHTASLIGG